MKVDHNYKSSDTATPPLPVLCAKSREWAEAEIEGRRPLKPIEDYSPARDGTFPQS